MKRSLNTKHLVSPLHTELHGLWPIMRWRTCSVSYKVSHSVIGCAPLTDLIDWLINWLIGHPVAVETRSTFVFGQLSHYGTHSGSWSHVYSPPVTSVHGRPQKNCTGTWCSLQVIPLSKLPCGIACVCMWCLNWVWDRFILCHNSVSHIFLIFLHLRAEKPCSLNLIKKFSC